MLRCHQGVTQASIEVFLLVARCQQRLYWGCYGRGSEISTAAHYLAGVVGGVTNGAASSVEVSSVKVSDMRKTSAQLLGREPRFGPVLVQHLAPVAQARPHPSLFRPLCQRRRPRPDPVILSF